MQIVTANELQHWLSQGEVLEKDSRGPKVIRLNDGKMLKIFRSRRIALLARLRPEATRFTQQAERLQSLDIHTPNILETYWLDPSGLVSACLYEPLAGQALDQIFRDQRAEFDQLLPRFAAYIYSLHQRGIYFRSLHLGNVLLTPSGEFGLIDFLDIHFKSGPLRRSLVQRNFEHLRSYLQRRKVQNFPWDELQSAYQAASQAGPQHYA